MKNLLSILTLLVFCGVATSGTAQVTFSPAAGTYSGSQSVSISCNPSSTTAIWYTTSGFPANTAATQYAGPIPVSATTTINAICATTEGTDGYDAEVNVQDSSNWKCNVPPGSSSGTCPGPVNSISGNGTSGVLSAYSFNPGSTATMSASTTSTGNTDSSLLLIYPNNPTATCDNCTTITEHLNIEPTEDATVIPGNEMDMEQCCDAKTNALRQASLQCNGGVWQIDASGTWELTTIPCNLSTTARTDLVFEAQWADGDTGCGGFGCMYLSALTVNGARYWPLAQYCSTTAPQDQSTSQNPSCAQEGMIQAPSNWNHWGAGNQHQIDLNAPATTCGQGSTCTGGRNIYTDNVTSTQGAVGAASATYTIEGTAAATPVISLPTGTYYGGQTATILDATPNPTISYCYTGVGTCSPSIQYTGGIWVDPMTPPTETLCANATASGYSESSTTCAYYVAGSAATAEPGITLATGTYKMPTSTTITDSAAGAAILWCYTGSGTCTPSTMYTSSIYININAPSTETICATAWAPGEGQSAAVCHTYTPE